MTVFPKIYFRAAAKIGLIKIFISDIIKSWFRMKSALFWHNYWVKFVKIPIKLRKFVFVWKILGYHHHHHHHIHFRALFSSTEGWAFWQVFPEGVLSTQNDFEGQQNPYLASFCHSQALHPMISLGCQIFSACVLLQSSLCCALHVQTISSYWCGAPHLSLGCQALWEGSLS